jgi:hypothetical protein
VFGLLACAVALWVLVGPDAGDRGAEIDARSRAKLERVLEQAEREAAQ